MSSVPSLVQQQFLGPVLSFVSNKFIWSIIVAITVSLPFLYLTGSKNQFILLLCYPILTKTVVMLVLMVSMISSF